MRVILNGNTQIKNGITTSTFGSIPDVPVTSFVLDLPQGPNSALTVNGKEFCTQTLIMPTTITAQSGKVDQTRNQRRRRRLHRRQGQNALQDPQQKDRA